MMRIIYHHRTRSTDAQRIHILEIANAFSELGHDVEIVSLVPTDREVDNASRDAKDAGWQTLVRRIPLGYDLLQLAYNLIGIPFLGRKLVARRPDFIYERYSLFNFTGVLVARLARIPLILEVNSPFALEQARDGQIVAVALGRWAEHVICNLASKVIVVSTPLKHFLIRAGVKPEKIVVMPNGVNLRMLTRQRSPESLKSSLGLQGKTVIGFVGWLRKWHGLDLLIEAFYKARLSEKSAAVLIIGDGPAMPELRALVDKLQLRQSVHFAGALTHAKVPEYLDVIDIAVQPAANEYCCPMKILEYMALGKAIVAPRQPNILDVLSDTEGVLFEPGNCDSLGSALDRLIGDQTLCVKLGQKGVAAIRAREYFWTKNAARVVDLVGSLEQERAMAGRNR